MAGMIDVLTIDVSEFFKLSRVRVCLNTNCANNRDASCNCKEIELDNTGRCLNFVDRE